MADLPLPQLLAEPIIMSDQGIALTPAMSGAGRGEALYDAAQYTIELVWFMVSESDRLTIWAFVEANRASSIEFTFRGHDYSAYMTPDGGPSEEPMGPYYTIRLIVRGTRTLAE